jgi:hypothetical protein
MIDQCETLRASEPAKKGERRGVSPPGVALPAG